MIRKTTFDLMRSGASIFELNEARQKLDLLKGGGLARMAYPAKVVSLILSDVIGDRIDVIASGPTAPRPGESFAHVQNVIVGSNAQAAEAAREQAAREGFHARVLTTALRGEARDAGRMLAGELRQSSPHPLCLIAGGETTVTVTGEGLGGRNQELALAAALEMDGLENVLLVSLATDGDDGTTGAAGAAVNGQTASRARALGLDAADFLRRNDSYRFFAPLNDLLITASTGTNVNDLVFLFAFG
jgi:hydroxypyruvate reductase